MNYDAFGKITWSNANSRNWNRTFTGQVLDAETGLMLYRNRYCNTELGRFVNRDPIGYEAYDENLYRYLMNQSLQFIDPLGLQFIRQIDAEAKIAQQQSRQKGGHNPNPSITQQCCNGVLYSPETDCCENKQIVSKVSIWICNRHMQHMYIVSRLDIPFSRSLQLNHSYVCCDGANKKCYGKQGYTKKTSPIPNERHDVKGKCIEKKVCPSLKAYKCQTPISACNYDALSANCHAWAWFGVD